VNETTFPHCLRTGGGFVGSVSTILYPLRVWARSNAGLKLNGLFLVLVLLTLAGCKTTGTFTRIPASYTTLSVYPDSEAYLIELIHATADPTATRYEFTIEGSLVTAQISTISKTGARSERRQSGEPAKKLLELFRGFDWGSIEAPLPDVDATPRVPDDTQVVLKARTQKSYRETQVKLADCESVRKLLKAIAAVQ
jgi:hypothetical protein